METLPSTIQLTSKAAAKIKTMSQKQGASSPSLRISIAPGGCTGAGYQYRMSFGGEISPDDTVAEADGAMVLVEASSLPILKGSVVDYEESLMHSGFVVNNPNAVSTCACGSSFTTSDSQGSLHVVR
ncbi:MAG: iron-sulfur cluster assembly accessory protein [Dehalococcoidia bacterium]|nr:iron-sulfur cluster assembly accessory protein [Dehalococcoidia bacterium]